MLSQKLLNVADTAKLLGMSQEEVKELAQKGHIEAYKIGGTYLRFKQDQVESLKEGLGKVKLKAKRVSRVQMLEEAAASDPKLTDKLKDFWYFNNFYITSVAIIVILIILISR